MRGQEQPTSTADLDFRPSWFEETAPVVLGSALIPEERGSGKCARGEDSQGTEMEEGVAAFNR